MMNEIIEKEDWTKKDIEDREIKLLDFIEQTWT